MNLQNLPARGELGNKMRSLIKSPHKDLVIVQADLSNIEARVFAYYLQKMCKDNFLADLFINGEDFHQANADRWGLTRDMAKKVLYLTLYGGTEHRLSSSAGVSLKEAKAIQKKFNDSQPSVNRLKNLLWRYVKKTGYVRTIMGRKIHYPDINSRNKWKVRRVERQSFNALLQGSAADIIKDLINKSYPIVIDYEAKMLATVHDEILILAHVSIAEQLKNELSELWNSGEYLLPIPTQADFSIGERWSEVH